MCVCWFFNTILYVNCFDKTVLYVCIQNIVFIIIIMYHVNARGVDKRMINVHYYYCYYYYIIIMTGLMLLSFGKLVEHD